MREEKTISLETAEGVAVFTLRQLPGMQAGKLLVRLTGTIGPGIAGLGLAIRKQDAESARAAVASIAEKLTPEEFENVSLQLLRGARVSFGENVQDVDKATLDSLFTGCSEGLFELVLSALKENYATFFDKTESLIKTALQTLKKSEAPRPSKPAGSSGPVSD